VTFDPNTVNPEAAAASPAIAEKVLAFRWEELESWIGNSPNVPEIQGQRDDWHKFKAPWDVPAAAGGGALLAWLLRDPDGLRAQANNLAVAEGNAARHGYRVPRLGIDAHDRVYRADPNEATGRNSPAPPLTPHEAALRERTGPPVVVAPPATPSRDTLHPTAKAIEDVIGTGGRPPGTENIPLKVAGLAALGLATVAGAVAVKKDSARAAIAGGGAVALVTVGYLLFRPGQAKERA
jgi:hypothetical protein